MIFYSTIFNILDFEEFSLVPLAWFTFLEANTSARIITNCAMRIVQGSIFRVPNAMCIVKWALCIVQFELCIVQCAFCIVQCALCNVHCALGWWPQMAGIHLACCTLRSFEIVYCAFSVQHVHKYDDKLAFCLLLVFNLTTRQAHKSS